MHNNLEKVFVPNTLLITYKGFKRDFPFQGESFGVKHLAFSTPLLQEQEVTRLMEEFSKEEFFPSQIVAIGGGVVLDLAKILRFEFAQKGHKAKLILSPSTAGTGSEATRFAVIYTQERLKKSIEDPLLLPDEVFYLDSLLMTLPKEMRISSGFDALCHAIESLWSCRSTPLSREKAESSLKIIKESFLPYVLDNNEEAAYAMRKAAFLSGEAINISYTTLGHALSYPLTSHWGISHGLAVFLFIPTLMHYNGHIPDEELNDERGKTHTYEMIEKIKKIIDPIDYFTHFQISPHLKDHQIFEKDIDFILRMALKSNRGGNNPRKMNETVLKELLR